MCFDVLSSQHMWGNSWNLLSIKLSSINIELIVIYVHMCLLYYYIICSGQILLMGWVIVLHYCSSVSDISCLLPYILVVVDIRAEYILSWRTYILRIIIMISFWTNSNSATNCEHMVKYFYWFCNIDYVFLSGNSYYYHSIDYSIMVHDIRVLKTLFQYQV